MAHADLPIGDILLRGAKVAQTSFGQKLLGHLAQPVLTDLREIELAKLEDDIHDEDKLVEKRSTLESLSKGFKENFARGDLISIGGIALMAIQNKLFPTKQTEPGLFERVFRFIALTTTLGGSLSAMFGRMFNLHKSVALGAGEFANLLSQTAEKHGKPIFTLLDAEAKQKLKEEAFELDKVLVYAPGIRESILERHEKDDIGGLLDGPPGTGKTDGVNCILGKWINRLEREGKVPEIAKLNLANFDDYLKQINKGREDLAEALQAGTGDNSFSSQSFTYNQGLLILEMLISKIQTLTKRREKYNHENPDKPQELAIFVDEFDKIFDPRSLQGCDKARLKSLLLQFNELFVHENILLTSNQSLEEMMTELKKHVQTDENDDAKTIIKPSYERLASKNRALVDLPGPDEQAEILAARLLADYAQFIDWNSFGIARPNTGSVEIDRKALAELIKPITREINQTDLSGRQLNYAVSDILGLLVYKARELRSSQFPVPDLIWDRMTREDKITRTGAMIDRAMIKTAIENKSNSVKFKHSDTNYDRAIKLVERYLSLDKVSTGTIQARMAPPRNNTELLNLLSKAYLTKDIGSKKVYIAKTPTTLEGDSYRHIIVQEEDRGSHSFYQQSNFSICLIKDGEQVTASKNPITKLSSDDLIDALNKSFESHKKKSLATTIKDTLNEVGKNIRSGEIDPIILELAKIAGK